MRRLTLLVLILAVAGAVMVSSTASGRQSTADDTEIRAVHARLVAELMSPFCQGLTLENCPTSGAAEMRDQILVWLQEGRTEAWIVDTLVHEWGETILGAPRFTGIGIVAWIAPAVLLLVAGAWMFVWIRRSVRSEPAQPPGAQALRVGDPDRDPGGILRQVDREVSALLD